MICKITDDGWTYDKTGKSVSINPRFENATDKWINSAASILSDKELSNIFIYAGL